MGPFSFIEKPEMIELRRRGLKCRAVREIRDYEGMVKASAEGTIQYELENLGRHLVNVQWDNGLRLNVLTDDIEIIDGDRLLQ
jgi:hypothetical protein